jgi:hypothetical protein
MDDVPADHLVYRTTRSSPDDRRRARATVAATIAGLRPLITQSSEGLTLVLLGRKPAARRRAGQGSPPTPRARLARRDGGSMAPADGADTVAARAAGGPPRAGEPAPAPSDPDAGRIEAITDLFMLPPGAVGVAVGVFDRIVSLDAFDDPDALRAAWPRLVAGAVAAWLDHCRAIDSGASPPPGRRLPDEGATGRLLRRASVALGDEEVLHASARAGFDDGLDVRISGERVEGLALVSRGRAVRLALLPRDAPDQPEGLAP